MLTFKQNTIRAFLLNLGVYKMGRSFSHLPGESPHEKKEGNIYVNPRVVHLHRAQPPVRHAAQVHGIVLQSKRKHELLQDTQTDRFCLLLVACLLLRQVPAPLYLLRQVPAPLYLLRQVPALLYLLRQVPAPLYLLRQLSAWARLLICLHKCLRFYSSLDKRLCFYISLGKCLRCYICLDESLSFFISLNNFKCLRC